MGMSGDLEVAVRRGRPWSGSAGPLRTPPPAGRGMIAIPRGPGTTGDPATLTLRYRSRPSRPRQSPIESALGVESAGHEARTTVGRFPSTVSRT